MRRRAPEAPPDATELARQTMNRLTVATNLANVGGIVVVFSFLGVLITGGVGLEEGPPPYLLNVLVSAGFLAFAFPFAILFSRRRGRSTQAYLFEGRTPDARDRNRLLASPTFGFMLSASLWSIAAVLLGGVNFFVWSPAGGITICATILLGGATTAAITSMVTERVLRPITAITLGMSPAVTEGTDSALRPGVARKLIVAWLLGTGVPTVGALAVVVAVISGELAVDETALDAALIMLAVALGVGLLMIVSTANTISRPIGAMRSALARVEEGDFGATVDIDDGSEVGLLQAGFNRMTAGLAEREEIREAFGTYVDPEVAERVIREGTMLKGEEVDLTILFLDVRGFTSFVERSEAGDVVSVLNRLFELIIPIIQKHGGHVNKFLGDGLLALFGAPTRHEDHADRALDAGIEIARAVKEEFGEDLSIGIGLNSGPVVAGNVGGAGRLEFSVIGDPVNTAARVEAATRDTGDTILITEATRSRLTRDNGVQFEERPAQDLKGKREPVKVCAVTAKRTLAGARARVIFRE
jgi:adenylate cyclase